MSKGTIFHTPDGYVRIGWCVLGVIVGLAAVVALIWWGVDSYATWEERKATERGRGDSPVTGIAQDADVLTIEMPDEFSGFATRCVWEGYRGFSTTNDGGAFVIPDEDCDMPDFTDREEVTP